MILVSNAFQELSPLTECGSAFSLFEGRPMVIIVEGSERNIFTL